MGFVSIVDVDIDEAASEFPCWECPNPYSAGIDFSRQSLTSVDVKFWRLKSIPAL